MVSYFYRTSIRYDVEYLILFAFSNTWKKVLLLKTLSVEQVSNKIQFGVIVSSPFYSVNSNPTYNKCIDLLLFASFASLPSLSEQVYDMWPLVPQL